MESKCADNNMKLDSLFSFSRGILVCVVYLSENHLGVARTASEWKENDLWKQQESIDVGSNDGWEGLLINNNNKTIVIMICSK